MVTYKGSGMVILIHYFMTLKGFFKTLHKGATLFNFDFPDLTTASSEAISLFNFAVSLSVKSVSSSLSAFRKPNLLNVLKS